MSSHILPENFLRFKKLINSLETNAELEAGGQKHVLALSMTK